MVFLPKMSNIDLEKTSDKPKLRDILQNNRLVLFKSIRF